MQRMVILVVLAALAALGGCASRDPNLAVRGLSEFGRAAGDYTLHVNFYELDAKGHPQLVVAEDPSLEGFVTRALAPKGYVLRADGPARYNLEVHLLCGNMRAADMGIMAEELRVPASVVGSAYTEQAYYWLPDKGLGTGSRETQDLRNSMQLSRSARTSGRYAQDFRGGTPYGAVNPDFCQGRVLVVLTPEATGPKREIFVSRAATDDCQAVPNCPVDVCRTALEQAVVELLESRF